MSRGNEKDDHDLIHDYQNGDGSAFVELYKKYCKYTCKILQYKGVPCADAEDLTQEIWIRMLASLKFFRFDCVFKTYLDRAIRNQFFNYIRGKNSGGEWLLHRIFEDQNETEDEKKNLFETIKGARSDEPDQPLIYKELLEVVRKCLQEITNKLMRITVAQRLEGLKIKQIAELLEIKFINTNVLVVRGMEKLRECVIRNYFI